MKKRSVRSIANKIRFQIIVLVLCVSGILSFLSYNSSSSNILDITFENLAEKTKDSSRIVEIELNDRKKELRYIATIDEININMPLEINPKPETLIRVLMTYKKLDNKIDIKEQKLTKIVRNGYTVVEWGGTEIK